jgi:putative acetyltransferase
MRDRPLSRTDAPALSLRAARRKEMPRLLKLIDHAIDYGCRDHYDYHQLRAILLGYCSGFVVDAVGPLQTLVAEIGGRLVAVAQWDVAAGVLRALFVDATIQGQGVGGALLAAVEACARAAGCSRIGGAMSLNAVPFYTRAGFRACEGPERVETAGVQVPVVWMEKSLGP